MNTLAAQQQALLQALWSASAEDARRTVAPHVLDRARMLRGLRAYRSHGRALAQRALAAAYPGVQQMLGEPDFAGLAQQHWLAHPPQSGDIAQWGGALAQHIEAIPALVEDQPRLADLARIEWALHRAAFARDVEPRLASLQLLQGEDPASIMLQLAPAACAVAGSVVWRQGLRPCERCAVPGEAEFIAALQAGRSLLDALQAAPALDFNHWLAPAVNTGLVLGARPLNPGELS
jgi:hypothetical protein